MPAIIVTPSTSYKPAFLTMLADFEARDPENADAYRPATAGFDRYVQGLLDDEEGINLKPGWVPCTHRWLIEPGGSIAGVTRLRHRIDTPFLASAGGHIGYDVAPSWRGRGYGHVALQASLAEARRRNLDRVLLFANETNIASRRVIERQGGELEAIVYSDYWNQRICRYWIDVPESFTPADARR